MTLLAHDEIKAAKKQHRCDWCNEPIDVGQPYVRQRSVDGRDVYTWRAHPECYEAAGTLDNGDRECEAYVTHARGCTGDIHEPCDCPGHQRWRAKREGGAA